jgi:hypothetical protein
VVVALGDDLEGEPRLGVVHREDGEVVDHEQRRPRVLAQGAHELAMDLCTGELVEHRGGTRDEHAACRLTDAVRESSEI